MKKKKVDKILKGVLTVGTVIGGANVMSDADMVYAAELETDSTAPVTEFDVPASTTEAAQEVTYLQSDAPAEVPSAADTAPTPVEPVARLNRQHQQNRLYRWKRIRVSCQKRLPYRMLHRQQHPSRNPLRS